LLHTEEGAKKQNSKKEILLSAPQLLTRNSFSHDAPAAGHNGNLKKEGKPGPRRSSTEQRVRFAENTHPLAEEEIRHRPAYSVLPRSPAVSCRPISIARPTTAISSEFATVRMTVGNLGRATNGPHAVTRGVASVPSAQTEGSPTLEEGVGPAHKAVEGLCQDHLMGFPSPVSPPDPDVVARMEQEMEADMTNMQYGFQSGGSTNLADEQRNLARPIYGIDFDSSSPSGAEGIEDTACQEMTEEQIFFSRVGKISNWCRYPPVQVAEEFIPKSKMHWNWNILELRGRDPMTLLHDGYVPGWESVWDSPLAIKYPSTF
jgi:hypothetical protein